MITTTATVAQGIRCGNCKDRHETVAEVKACHQGQLNTVVARPAAPLPTDGPLATARQTGFLRDLCRQLDTTLEHEANLDTLTIPGASQLIDELKARVNAAKATLPTVQTTMRPANLPDVHPGRYALDYGNNEIKFFLVDRPTEGRWAGRTFVTREINDGEAYPVRGEAARTVLAEIAKDQKAAMLLYGQKLERCGHCNRGLRKKESRERGIGPICAGKMGW